MKKIKIEHSVLPGLRIIKTVVALAIVMVISICSDGHLAPYDMAVVAILAIQDDVAQSYGNRLYNKRKFIKAFNSSYWYIFNIIFL